MQINKASVLLSHHDIVVRRGHFKGFLHKYCVDDSDGRKAYDQLVGHVKDSEVFLIIGWLWDFIRVILGYFPPILENGMEKKMENEMETVVILG